MINYQGHNKKNEHCHISIQYPEVPVVVLSKEVQIMFIVRMFQKYTFTLFLHYNVMKWSWLAFQQTLRGHYRMQWKERNISIKFIYVLSSLMRSKKSCWSSETVSIFPSTKILLYTTEENIFQYSYLPSKIHLPVWRMFFDFISSSFVSSPNRRSCITDFDFLICRLKDKNKMQTSVLETNLAVLLAPSSSYRDIYCHLSTGWFVQCLTRVCELRLSNERNPGKIMYSKPERSGHKAVLPVFNPLPCLM